MNNLRKFMHTKEKNDTKPWVCNLISDEETLTKYQIKFGGVAQLGEHLPCKQGVRSSILLISTNITLVIYSIFVVP